MQRSLKTLSFPATTEVLATAIRGKGGRGQEKRETAVEEQGYDLMRVGGGM